MNKTVFFFGLAILMFACKGTDTEDQDDTSSIIQIETRNMDIIMPDTLQAGIRHLVYQNHSEMTHFLLFNKVPPQIGLEEYSKELTQPFQDVMDAIMKGEEPPNNFPEWLGEMVNMGGVGLTSPGQRAESYINLTPGNYVVECYIKTNAVFHSTAGMLKQIQVIDSQEDADVPSSTVAIEVDSSGIKVMESLNESGGIITFKITYGPTKLYANFTRPDIHLAKVNEDTNLELLGEYMNWATPAGMDGAAPITFLGGVQEMPEGNIAYFSQDLSPGKYILIGEVPQPIENGFYIEFEISK